ncbi:MAG: AAA family ATPase [Candidatus Nanoarchaeia archaeon]|nr:AAA family ATPase [Candidatus Nanoarchaeia archaeon]
MINKLTIENFRCISSEKYIDFEKNLTIIIGENDAGKTTILNALEIVLGNMNVDENDFCYGKNEIVLKLETTEFKIVQKFNKIDKNKNIKEVIINKSFLNELCSEINKIEAIEENIESIKVIGDYVQIKKGSSGIEKYKNNIIEKIKQLLSTETSLNNSTILNLYKADFLDSKKIENVNEFINKTYINDFKKEIWDKIVPIEEGKTLKDLIDYEFEKEIDHISLEINKDSFISSIKKYNKDIQKISLNKNEIPFKNIDASVNVSVVDKKDNEIDFEKKGDGTKRRMTMSLFELRANSQSNSSNYLYVLDEPDTHLHVRAQGEFLEILNKMQNKQIIITTHSPFLINASQIEKIRFIEKNIDNIKIKKVKSDEELDSCMEFLGVENINIFFSKKIILVEGETEEEFFKEWYRSKYNISIKSKFVKIINIKGIYNAPGFVKALMELGLANNTIALFDNDVLDIEEEDQNSINTIINGLGLKENENFFKIGIKEFEDSFNTNDIYNSWFKYAECEKENQSSKSFYWNLEEIEKLKEKCSKENLKFSSELKKLTVGMGKKFTKPIFGRLLAKYTLRDNLDDKIVKTLDFIDND